MRMKGHTMDEEKAEKRVEAVHNNIALMAAILLSGDFAEYGPPKQAEIEAAVCAAEKIHAVIWDRNSSDQIENRVIDMAEEAHFPAKE